MFKFKKKENDVLAFLKAKDIEVANAYRTNTVNKLNNGFSRKAVRRLADDMVAHLTLTDFSGVSETNKYTVERFIERKYEIISEDNNKVVIKRFVNFKNVKVLGILTRAAESFVEIFEIDKTEKGFVIADVVAA